MGNDKENIFDIRSEKSKDWVLMDVNAVKILLQLGQNPDKAVFEEVFVQSIINVLESEPTKNIEIIEYPVEANSES